MRNTATPTAPHLDTGRQGEDFAAAALGKAGMRILARNWRPREATGQRNSALELDIVATQGDTLIFAEVKTRTHAPGAAFKPQDAFTPAKRRNILQAVMLYLQEYDLWHMSCRVDLLCVTVYPDKNSKMEHFENVLTLSRPSGLGGAMGGGHTPWQPW